MTNVPLDTQPALSVAAAAAKYPDGIRRIGSGIAYHTGPDGMTLILEDGAKVATIVDEADGLFSVSAGGQTIIELGAEVEVSVMDLDGIHADGATGFKMDVAGSVRAGDRAGAAIRTASSAGGTMVDIASGVEVMGASGIAIQDGDGDSDITSAGDITSDIDAGAGNDTLELREGSLAGDVYVGEDGDTSQFPPQPPTIGPTTFWTMVPSA